MGVSLELIEVEKKTLKKVTKVWWDELQFEKILHLWKSIKIQESALRLVKFKNSRLGDR